MGFNSVFKGLMFRQKTKPVGIYTNVHYTNVVVNITVVSTLNVKERNSKISRLLLTVKPSVKMQLVSKLFRTCLRLLLQKCVLGQETEI